MHDRIPQSTPEAWYIVADADGQCHVSSRDPRQTSPQQPSSSPPKTPETRPLDFWGPFPSQGDAIAKRIGLIRSGKCKAR